MDREITNDLGKYCRPMRGLAHGNRSVQKELDIILLTHNNVIDARHCMEALYQNTHIKFWVTVIDDSTDETPAYFMELAKEKRNINYVRPDVHIKIANQAINIGLGLTKSDPVAFLTCTTFVGPDWLGPKTPPGISPFAIRLMENDPKVGLVGFKVVSPETNLIIEAGDDVLPDGSPVNCGSGASPEEFTYVKGVKAIGCCAFLMRRAAVPKGGWDEDTYIGFRCVEDLDNCLSIVEKGWKILYNGMACVYHQPSSSSGSDGGNQENYNRFKGKWNGEYQ